MCSPIPQIKLELRSVSKGLFSDSKLVAKVCRNIHDEGSFQSVVIQSIQLYTCTRVSVYRVVLISGGWNRGVPLYTEVSSFQGVGIEEFHCIQRCPHFRVLE